MSSHRLGSCFTMILRIISRASGTCMPTCGQCHLCAGRRVSVTSCALHLLWFERGIGRTWFFVFCLESKLDKTTKQLKKKNLFCRTCIYFFSVTQ